MRGFPQGKYRTPILWSWSNFSIHWSKRMRGKRICLFEHVPLQSGQIHTKDLQKKALNKLSPKLIIAFICWIELNLLCRKKIRSCLLAIIKPILKFEFFVYFFQSMRQSYRVFNSGSEKIIGQNSWNFGIGEPNSLIWKTFSVWTHCKYLRGISSWYQDKSETFF